MNTDLFKAALNARFQHARSLGQSSININSGDLHREVGGYPGPGHCMPTCCNVMTGAMHGGDRIVAAPPKGRGASLTIHYQLPR